MIILRDKKGRIMKGGILFNSKHPSTYPSNKGKKFTQEHRRKIGLANKGKSRNIGENHWNWQGGKTSWIRRLRISKEYILWRTAVFMRDDYICQFCRKRGGKLQADHIKPLSRYPELGLAIDNGRTLCENCHRQTDTYGLTLLFRKTIKV